MTSMANERSQHLLVVDDDREIRDLVSRFLTRHGYRVTTARDGREMKQALAEWSIDLIVLDLMLPGTDGLTLCRELRASSKVPVIMLTAMGEEMDRIVGLDRRFAVARAVAVAVSATPHVTTHHRAMIHHRTVTHHRPMAHHPGTHARLHAGAGSVAIARGHGATTVTLTHVRGLHMSGRAPRLGRAVSQDRSGSNAQQRDPCGGRHDRFGKLRHCRISLLRPVDLLPLLVIR